MTTEPFVFSDEQRLLRETVRDACGRAWPPEDVERTAHGDRAAKFWTTLASELGVVGLTVPEERGGLGAGVVDLAIVAEELGRVVAAAPLLGTTLATETLARLGGGTAADLLEHVLGGDRLAALVVTDDAGTWRPDRSATTARSDDGGWRVDGTARGVLDGAAADDLLVLSATAEGSALLLVDGTAEGVVRRAVETIDLTRELADITFTRAAARPVAMGHAVVDAVQGAADIATIVLAAEQLGGCQTMLDRTAEHARTHIQFGRPIGSFQAVRHRCADMLVATEHARSAVYHAAWAADTGIDDVALASSLAHVVASAAHTEVSGGALQLHGGIGFTWEHPTHLYLKRAWSDATLLGGRNFHRARLAPLLEPPAA
jgi:alkylation response protein AidB-like acyl-CoA dehydrogenase